ncbi:succinoglycan biosynthesis protein ExoA [Altererythrobacter atlanticus]|uniref:Poly-beta-1,6-N-acetyl-D-glucosamine synthase n=1 Tax=Croceibacterium atlanticum TaxID=1267766 RepID=A0A0F7KU48_9SPHN|nr:glycosyltransferase family 2 protein [Croceibacterium atlanticum]AKH42797.1 Poly-beta-1,6-N-acetyl-D-glucosamine synthase [Croceibacterium atlanticum]MBB5731577.1 succinoglycan biosynthesis protein ExoA [Croceibacterium atlanticum]
MSILAVIPCLNEINHIGVLLDQFLADPDIGLLVVADGGSSDGTREIVQQRAQVEGRLILLDNPARIQSAGINLAVARYGQGYDWLLRIDAHCLYPGGYAAMLVAAAEEHGASAIAVPMVTSAASGFQLAAATAQNSVLGTGGSAHRHLGGGRFVEHGHHALIRMDMFRELLGYCENMPCNEDAEFDYRQTSAGGRIWLEPKAAITYFPRKSPGALWRQYYRYGRGRAQTIQRHRMKPRLRQMVPLAAPLIVALLPLGFAHWIFSIPAFAWLVLCLAGGALIGMRNGGGWAMLSGIAAAIMHLSWGCGFLAQWFGGSHRIAPKLGLSR